ncbi:MAG: SWIM zinc finger family protein [Sulfurovum sp.]|nr:SWIM zinc finger family protein [Sulfurovum sp.]
MKSEFILRTNDIRENFYGQTYTRGQSYYQKARVQEFDIYIENTNTTIIRSEVKGTRAYQQKIDLIRHNDNLNIEGYCTCPVGYNCKHVVAVLFKVASQNIPKEKEDIADRWLKQFMKVHKKTPLLELETAQEAFLIIRLFRKSDNDFEFCKAKILKNGSLSKGVSISLENMMYYHNLDYQYPYLTEEDKELISQLSNTATSGSSGYRGEHKFKDEYGAWILKKLVQSAKCYLKDSTTPLRYVSETKKLTFEWIEDEGKHHLVSNLQENEELIANTIPALCMNIETNTLYEVDTNYAKEELECMFNAPVMSNDEMTKVTQKIVETLPDASFPLPQSFEIEEVSVKPRPTFVSLC